MTAADLLQHYDSGQLWSGPLGGDGSRDTSDDAAEDVAKAYQVALAVRQLRLARGEQPRGFKIGFTNRSIWQRYNVFAPIWGTVWNTTLVLCQGQGELALSHICQPRIEPEAVFGMRASPAANATLQDLFEAIEWVAPGFEIVQSHQPDWKFAAADAVRDFGLHAKLLVGRRVALSEVAGDAAELDAVLAKTRVELQRDGSAIERGVGSNVLDSPLRALHHFLTELRQCPGAPELLAGDVVTTGTWTDAWPVAVGQTWRAQFEAPLSPLQLRFI